MPNKINIPLFLEIKPNIIDKITHILEENNVSSKNLLVLFDKNTYNIAGKKVLNLLENSSRALEIENSSSEWIDKTREVIHRFSIGLILAVGGGKVIDIAKYAVYLEDINFISFPTIPSNDGIASPIAVIDGKSLGAKAPLGVIVDLKIMQSAPLRYIHAGIGDLISNLSAVEDWRIASNAGKEKFSGYSALLSESAAELILNSNSNNLKSNIFLDRLVRGLLLSGIAMIIAKSSHPSSGGEHEISHAMDKLFTGKALHGEQVSLGTLFTLYLQKNGKYNIIKSFFKKYKLPYNYSQLGFSLDEFIDAIAYAPNTRKDRYTILEKLNLSKKEIIKKVKEVFE
jgi:glycerol-1-phosphate dehydrogenase [NAD(P)+]